MDSFCFLYSDNLLFSLFVLFISVIMRFVLIYIYNLYSNHEYKNIEKNLCKCNWAFLCPKSRSPTRCHHPILWVMLCFVVYFIIVWKVHCGADSSPYECANKMCVPDTWRCDGENDCGDSSDEVLGCGKNVYMYIPYVYACFVFGCAVETNSCLIQS